MECFFCGTEMEMGFTVHEAETQKCIVIIKNVPCMKCGGCGERVYSGDVAMRLEEIIEKCEKAAAEKEIVNFKLIEQREFE